MFHIVRYESNRNDESLRICGIAEKGLLGKYLLKRPCYKSVGATTLKKRL